MKKIIIITMLLITATTSFSQQTNASSTLTKQDYLKKSKNQKTAAWILFGGGATIGFIRLTQLNFAGSDGEVNNGSGTIMFLTGTAAVITSIPFFSAAKKNKKKAASVSLKMDKVPHTQKGSFVHRSYPSLSYQISL